MTAARDPTRDTLVIAHRGASTQAPENSLAAFELALQQGADMVELDVRRTADGELICFHDGAVGGIEIAELSRAQLTQAGSEPALFADAVALVAARGGGMDVEVKAGGYTDEVVAALAPLDPQCVVVTSFLDGVVSEVTRRAPQLRTGLLVGRDLPVRPLRMRLTELAPTLRAAACGADYIAMHFVLAELGALARAAQAGFPALIWTVNDERRLRRYLSDGRVAGVITDVPDLALSLRPHGPTSP
jgi:glycerophosphoryl diester phosphodiesterase